jgi:hypothetical protein
MKINVSPMNYGSLLKKLNMGVALADRDRNVKDIAKFNSEIEQKLLASAVKTGQVDKSFLGSFGQTDLMAQLQSGDFLPNEFMGWSSKTILAGLALLLLLKIKKARK